MAVAAGAAAALLALTGIVPEWGRWYSSWSTLRFQTEAMLRGSLAIQDTPIASLHDWAWGNGVQQVWGLGVPALHLPLEAAAKVLGFVGFPDRVAFVLYFAAAAAAYFLAARGSKAPFAGLRSGRAAVETVLCLFAPVLLSLVASRFHDYERAIAFGWLWSLFLLSLLVVYLRRPSDRLFVGICAAAGFAPWIRPTIALYGLAAAAAAWAARRPSRPATARGLAVAVTAVALLLAANAWRFGEPLEFGHSLTFVDESRLEYALKFDYPYRSEPLGSAARELAAATFLGPMLNGMDFYRGGIHSWFSPTFRTREFAFSTFAPWGLAWLVLALAALVAFRRLDREIRFIAIWAIVAFLGLFVFYLRVPMIASRYVADFGPALSAAAIAVYRIALIAAERGLRFRLYRPWAGFGLVTAIALGLWAAELLDREGNWRFSLIRASTAAEIRLNGYSPLRRPPKHVSLPTRYSCGRADVHGIHWNLSAWDFKKSCAVTGLTTRVFASGEPACMTLDVAYSPWAGPRVEAYPLDAIRARRGLVDLVPRSLSRRGDTWSLKLCDPEPEPEPETGYSMFVIAWVDTVNYSGGWPPFVLRRIRFGGL